MSGETKLDFRVELPELMEGVHDVFNASMVWKYFHDIERHDHVANCNSTIFNILVLPLSKLEESERVIPHMTLELVTLVGSRM
jgi:hypothetical protein